LESWAALKLAALCVIVALLIEFVLRWGASVNSRPAKANRENRKTAHSSTYASQELASALKGQRVAGQRG